MPQGSKTIDLDSSVEVWIDKFNKAKGWNTIRAPGLKALKREGSGQKLSATPKDLYESQIGELDSRKDLETALKTGRSDLSDLELKKAGEKDPAELEKIEDEIDELRERIAEAEGDLELLARLEKRLKQVKDVEGSLKSDLTGLQKLLETMQEEVEKVRFDLSTLDPAAVKRFRVFHGMVAGNIENARQELVTLTGEAGGKPVSKKYAVINSQEYKLLYGMLEEAILLLQLGKLDQAMASVQKAADGLVEYRNARTGAEPIAQREKLDERLDEPLLMAESMIETLTDGGYLMAAQARQDTYDGLVQRIRTDVSAKTPGVGDKYMDEVLKLCNGLQADVGGMHQAEEAIATAQRDVASLRVNAHEDRALQVEGRIQGFIPGPKVADNVKGAFAIRDFAAQQLKEAKDRDALDAKIDPKALEQAHKALVQKFEQLQKSNKKLPAETASEIELQLLAAGQLLASDSIDALKKARMTLEVVAIFLKNIDSYPKAYELFKDLIAGRQKAINKAASKYALYEVGRRNDLTVELDRIRGIYLTHNQKEVQDALIKLGEGIEAYKTLCARLRGEKKAAQKLAEAIDKVLEDIGKTLTKQYSNQFITFDGYHGKLATDLATARAKIDKRTEGDLKEAADDLAALKVKADQMKADLASFKAGKLDDSRKGALSEFVADARNGQAEHQENLAKEKEFKTAVDQLDKRLDALAGVYKRLKSDPSDVQGLEAELKALKKQTSSERSYLEGLDRLKEMDARTARLEKGAERAAEIVDKGLAEAARACVVRVEIFVAQVKGLFEGVIKKAAVDDTGKNQFDTGTFDAAKVKKFCDSIVAAMPTQALDDLPDAAAVVADGEKPVEERRAARTRALAAVRALMGVFDGFKPIAHLRANPFDATVVASLDAARQALPRLEIRLLTAIKD